MIDRAPTVQRNQGLSGPMGGVVAVAILGLVEFAIIGVLILMPVLGGDELTVMRIALCAVLLTLTSGAFVAVSLVKVDGKLRWRWALRQD